MEETIARRWAAGDIRGRSRAVGSTGVDMSADKMQGPVVMDTGLRNVRTGLSRSGCGGDVGRKRRLSLRASRAPIARNAM